MKTVLKGELRFLIKFFGKRFSVMQIPHFPHLGEEKVLGMKLQITLEPSHRVSTLFLDFWLE